MRTRAMGTLVAAALLLTATPAFADATAFVGVNTTPSSRLARGLAVGVGFLIFGFEGEYTYTNDDLQEAAPEVKMGNGNVLLQTPFEIHGVQPYVTAGVGFYSETLATRSDSGFLVNTGGGVKVAIAGPIRVRVDYRVLKMGSGALASPAHRIYAGVNLKF
jgi:opacity protein-like surface antigen